MADFDSIINVEEWISDYYLVTDEKGSSYGKRVDGAVKEWKKDEKEDMASPWSRFLGLRNELQLALADVPSDPDQDESDQANVDQTNAAQADSRQTKARPAKPAQSADGERLALERAYELLRQAFGYGAPERLTADRDGQELSFFASTDAQRSAYVLYARPLYAVEDFYNVRLWGTDDDGQLPQLEGKPAEYTAAALVGELFLTENPPQMIVVFAGNWVILAERETWPLGRFLAVNVALAVERNDTRGKGELQRVVAALAAEHTQRAADGTTWWLETLEDSRQHSVKVSEELRGAIKDSIEVIGNDVLERRRLQKLPAHDVDGLDGNELAKQALRYLYRILFLLFAESSPELQILPTGNSDYDEGYGLTRLRDLILTEPTGQRAQNGTHLYWSLQNLFALVNQGHDPEDPEGADFDANATEDGLVFRNLEADLFLPQATRYINEVQLSNKALTRVLQNLLLTKEKRGSDRGFISYATLGVSELGQVYEGLMSYTGFIAEEDLVEVAKNGDPSKGSWVVTEGQVASLPPESIVYETRDTEFGEERRPRRHRRGSFVYRQSSRDRERSASFYSPPAITEFTVGQAIEELEASGRIDTADDVLTLTICEPAMGSGAFAVEAVNQLAELYLRKKEQELGDPIPGENRAVELQKVKAHIALHQVYGVDLNQTAVELAEISLWLNTMTSDLKAPWFGLRLRHGNSLIGAARATFHPKDLKKKAYLSTAPQHHPLTGLSEAIDNRGDDMAPRGRVHHFLVPSKGWGSAVESKDLKQLLPDEVKKMKAWQKQVQKGLTAAQITQAKEISVEAEKLWALALVRLRIAEDQVRRDVDIYGQDTTPTAKNVTRATIERELLHNGDGAYRRLRLAMDTWNALWFWPLTATDELPDMDEYLAAMRDLLGHQPQNRKKDKQDAIGADMEWHEVDYLELLDREASQRVTKLADVLEAHPWLRTAQEVAEEQAFFHWDLDFATVMARGGFDFQVGNPPWVRPDVDFEELLSEHDPWFNLAHKPTQAQKKERRERLRGSESVLDTVSRGVTEAVTTAAVLRDQSRYPHLAEQRPDLYRGFMERTWASASDDGVISLVHPESHFTEKKAAPLRAGAYRRLRRHWQFVNELQLFDIDHHNPYGIHIYGPRREHPEFLMAASVYHPQTVVDSFAHDGSGKLPGFKDDNGNWDLRPHRDRIITVDEDMLATWRSILEDPSTPLLETRMVYSVNSEASRVLAKLARAPRIAKLGLQYSSGWNETTDKKAGYFDSSWQHPDSWDDVILQGPHLGVSTPMIKQPNPTMKHNQDWSEIDLEAIPRDFIPATAYKPLVGEPAYTNDYGHWKLGDATVPVKNQYRVGWRTMAAATGYRTIYPAILPVASTHIFTITSAGIATSLKNLVLFGVSLSSIVVDFMFRSTGLSHILPSTAELLPVVPTHFDEATRNYLRLNCLTEAYAPLWEELTGAEWTEKTPLRNARERWHAQNEIDAMVALSLDVTIDELLMIYRTQFPVMRKYDLEDLYDVNGRKVPKDIVKLHKKLGDGAELSEEDRTWTHPQSGVEYVFEYPFAPLDREADLRAAYEKYAELI